MKSFRSFLLPVLLIGLLVFAGCYHQDDKDTGDNDNNNGEETQTKTYTNTNLGFSIEHPANWSVTVLSTGAVSFFYPGTGGEPALQVQRMTGSAQSVYEQKKKLSGADDKGDETVNGQKAKAVCFKETEGKFCEYYIDGQSGYSFAVADYTDDEVYETFKVLSTSS